MSNERIIFRRGKEIDLVILEERDIPLFLKWLNDEEVTRYLPHNNPIMEAQEKKWFQNLAKNWQTNQVFGIATKAGQLIGNIGLHHINYRHGTATAGIVIGEKSFWNKGFASEAEGLLIKYAFKTLFLRKINASVLAENKWSLRAAIKNGAREEGRRARQVFITSHFMDEVMLAFFRD